jgi:hypothetical protein
VKIMKKKIFYASLVALLMLLTAAPALATQPKLTYAYGGHNSPDPANPGIKFTTNDIYHGRDVGGIGFSTGSPWGDLALVYTGNYEVNIVSYLGTGINHYMNTNSRVRVEGINNYEFTGAGWLIYHGPTFTATTPDGVAVTVSEGKPFTGLLLSGMTVAHGTADDKGVQIRTTYSGVNLAGPLTYGLVGNIVWGTATYWYTGN